MNMARSNSIVVAMLVLSLAACGGSTKSKSTGSGGNAANTSTDGTGGGGTGTDTGAGTGTDGGTGGTDGGGTTTPSVISVTLTPASASVAMGTSQQYTAIAVYSDATKQDVTATATWSVAPAGVGTIDAAGHFAGLAAGAGTISAAFGGITGSAPVAVTAATLQALSLTPSADSGPVGIPVPFTAMGIFSDSTQQDLTSAVTWSSSDPTRATITTAGVLSPVAPGMVTVTASSNGVTASTTYTVTTAVLNGFDVVPGTVLIAQGTTATLQATGYYDDGTSYDVTPYATWSSSSPTVGVANGVVTGVSVGTATVTGTFGGMSDTATVTVTAFTLQSIAVAPASVALHVGLSQQLAATGTFSDGSTQDLTTLVAWVSSNASAASVSNDPGSAGLVSAIAPGSATVTAMIGAFQATASVEVSSAAVQSIAVNGPQGLTTLPKNYKAQFLATATYTDGTTVDVTKEATWVSSNTAVATISTAPGSQGLATGIAAGTTTLTATLSGVTGTFGLTVSTAKLSSLDVTPGAFTIAVGGTQQLTAIGTFSDGSILDITRQCSWRSQFKFIAWVSKAGLVTGASAGTTNIVVRKGSVKATSPVATVQ